MIPTELQQRPCELTCQPLLELGEGKLEKLLSASENPQRISCQKVRHPCIETKRQRVLSETLSVKPVRNPLMTLVRKNMTPGQDHQEKITHIISMPSRYDVVPFKSLEWN